MKEWILDAQNYNSYLLNMNVKGKPCLSAYGVTNYSRVREAVTSPDIPATYGLGCFTGTTLCVAGGAKDAGLRPPEGFSNWDDYEQEIKKTFEAWETKPNDSTAELLDNLVAKGQERVTEAIEKLKTAKTFCATLGQITGTLSAGIYATYKYLELPENNLRVNMALCNACAISIPERENVSVEPISR